MRLAGFIPLVSHPDRPPVHLHMEDGSIRTVRIEADRCDPVCLYVNENGVEGRILRSEVRLASASFPGSFPEAA